LTAAIAPRDNRGWLRFGGAILFVLVSAGCSPSAASGGPTAGSVATTRPSVSAASAGATSGAAAAQLAAALDPLRAASTFATTVAVDGATVVTARGRAVGPASRLTVTTAGRSVEYVEIPPKAWARATGGAWVLVAADQAPGAPLDALARPLTLEPGPAAGGSSFSATYPATALGLEGDPLTVAITVDGDAVTFRYEATTAGRATSSTTTIRPAPADPITAPAS